MNNCQARSTSIPDNSQQFRCCLQIAVCSHKPELPQESTGLHTGENFTFHAVIWRNTGNPQLKTLLLNDTDVCTTKVGCTKLLKHQIFLTNPLPIWQKPYRVSPPKLNVMKELIDDMLKDDVIEPSSSPVVMITRKVSKPRFCVDFRKVNEKAVTDAYLDITKEGRN